MTKEHGGLGTTKYIKRLTPANAGARQGKAALFPMWHAAHSFMRSGSILMQI